MPNDPFLLLSSLGALAVLPTIFYLFLIANTWVARARIRTEKSIGFSTSLFKSLETHVLFFWIAFGVSGGFLARPLVHQLASVEPTWQFLTGALLACFFALLLQVGESAGNRIMSVVVVARSGRDLWLHLTNLVALGSAVSFAYLVGVCLAIVQPWPRAWTVLAFVLAGCFIGGLIVAKKITGLRQGTPVPLEDLPLHAELNRVLEQFDQSPRKWRMVPMQPRDGGEVSAFSRSSILHEWYNSMKAQEIDTIPGPVLHALDASTITSVVSVCEAARQRAKGSKYGFLVVLLFCLLFCWGGYEIYRLAGGNYYYLGASAFAFLIVLQSLDNLKQQRRGSAEEIRRAWQAWAAAEPSESRTPIDFLRSSIQYDRAMKPDLDPHFHLTLIIAHRPLFEFIDRETGGRGRETIRECLGIGETQPEARYEPPGE